ncbi:MAG: WG repeat-containing protein [Prevotellaceae bacterium]|jgi:hypothetical protein|nr:WG repeat-containing protein [Prevotellaceae bacterium]
MNNDTRAVYLVKNHFSQCDWRRERIVGIYFDKENALEVAKKEWDKYGKWQSRLAVPYMLYIMHIDDFEKKYSEDQAHAWWYDFHDYLGYTGQEWQLTRDVVRAASNDNYRQTNVLACNLDAKGIPPKIIWEKKWKETKLIPCRENDKWGFRDEVTHKFVVPPTYDNCTLFQYKTVCWDEGNPYSYQRKVDCWGIKNADSGKWGVVNENGQLIIPAEYDEIGNVMFDGLASSHFFKVSKNGKYGLLTNHGEVELPLEYDDLQDQLYEKSGILYVSVQRNGKQERHIINENEYRYSEARQELLDSWFEWTEETIEAVVRLNRTLIDMEKDAREEYNARKAELTKDNNSLTNYDLYKSIELSILIEDEKGELTEPTEGIYAALNEMLSTAAFITDSEKDWTITLDKDIASYFNAIHYGIYVLRSQLLFAWEDILKIRSVWAEVEVDYQKKINIAEK